jgi:hypothetical protein
MPEAAAPPVTGVQHSDNPTDNPTDNPLVVRLRRVWRFEVIVVALAALPLVVAMIRALVGHWIPVGENATMAIRARDVLTADHPWVGTMSSASLTSAESVNHPGPLLFDLLAAPVRAFGSGVGLVLGVFAINLLALVTAARAAFVTGGRRFLVWAMVGAAGLSWSLGSALLIDPWNPHVVLMSFYALLVCAAAVGAGQIRWLSWMVGFGSLVLQTHVSYIALVPVVFLASLGLFVWGRRHQAFDGEWRRPAVVAGLWFAVLWAQPVAQQFFGSGPGNLTALVRSGTAEQPRVGFGLAVRLVTRVVVEPPTWARPSFADSLVDLRLRDPQGVPLPLPAWLPGSVAAAVLLGLVVLVLVAAGTWSLHRRRWTLTPPVVISLVCLVASVYSTSAIPAGGYGVAPHQLRFLWPIGVYWMIALGHLLTGSIVLVSNRVITLVRVVAIGLLATFAVAGAGRYEPPVGVARAPGPMATVRDIVHQVDAATLPPVVVDLEGLWIGEPFTIPVLDVLTGKGAAVYVPASAGRQFGLRRVVPADVRDRLFLREGPAALICPAGTARVALSAPGSATSDAAFRTSYQRVVEIVGNLAVALEPDALAAVPELAAAVDEPEALSDLVLSGRFTELSGQPELADVLDDAGRAMIAAFEAQRATYGFDTIAAFVGPRTDLTTVPDEPPVTSSDVIPGSSRAACPDP